MSRLIHLIYSSTAKVTFDTERLIDLLGVSRRNNVARDITGMLLHIEGSFLQVIEGQDSDIDALFAIISADPRHGNITTIIRESIPRRAFGDWKMGFADITAAELDELDGVNDFLTGGVTAQSLVPGRAQKLLNAFKDGRWRSKASRPAPGSAPVVAAPSANAPSAETGIAFQPIISASQGTIWSHEALAWDIRMQREMTGADFAPDVLASIEAVARQRAMLISARPGTAQGININVRPASTEDAIATMQSIIDLANAQNIDSRIITLELNQDYLNGDLSSIITIVQDCKENGLRICLDDFGAGRSGLNQMEMSQPNAIALNAKLVRDVDTNGAKQAIVRGLIQTCDDLGIDLIAKHVETRGEFDWLLSEGVDLFQGGLLGHPQLDVPATHARIPQ